MMKILISRGAKVFRDQGATRTGAQLTRWSMSTGSAGATQRSGNLHTAFILVFTMGMPVFAAPTTMPITLESCLAEALRNNRTLQSLQHNLEAAQAQTDVATAGHLPTVGASAQMSRTQDVAGDDRKTSQKKELNAKISLPLFTGMRTTLEIEKSTNEQKKAETQLALGNLQAAFAAESGYYRLLFAQQYLAQVKLLQQRFDAQSKLMKLKYASGTEAKWALSKAEADAHDANDQIANAQDDVDAAVRALNVILSPPTPRYYVAQGDFSLHQAPPSSAEFAALARQHPEIAVLKHDIAVSLFDVNIETSKYWPQLSAFSSVHKNFGDASNPSWAVGLEATIPLFQPSLSANVRKTKETAATKELTYALRADELANEIQTALGAYRSRLASVTTSKLRLNAAHERAIIIEQEYTAGLRSFVDWEQAQTQLIQAEKNALIVRHEASLALANLRFKSGGLLP